MVSSADPRWTTGEIQSINVGKIAVKDANTGESLGQVTRDDPRWETGEIVSVHMGKTNAFDPKTGKCLGSISIDDPRWMSGGAVGGSFKGWHHTPFGSFSSFKMMGDVGVSASAVRRWCRDPDVKVGRINISRVTYL